MRSSAFLYGRGSEPNDSSAASMAAASPERTMEKTSFADMGWRRRDLRRMHRRPAALPKSEKSRSWTASAGACTTKRESQERSDACATALLPSAIGDAESTMPASSAWLMWAWCLSTSNMTEQGVTFVPLAGANIKSFTLWRLWRRGTPHPATLHSLRQRAATPKRTWREVPPAARAPPPPPWPEGPPRHLPPRPRHPARGRSWRCARGPGRQGLPQAGARRRRTRAPRQPCPAPRRPRL